MTKKAKIKQLPAARDAAEDLQDFLEDGLKDMYWAEKALVKALPLMKINAKSSRLKKGIADHLAETKEHVKRLEEVFALLGKTPRVQKCDAMDGLLKEGKDIIKETEPGMVRDIGIIAASQKVEHYEIASYGSLSVFASKLGHTRAARLLEKNLKEEKKCNDLLTKITNELIR